MKSGIAIKAWLWSALLALSLAFSFLLTASDSNAQASKISFDHNRTTFPLVGSHTRTQCDACHSRGIFKGTPRQCVICHVKGSQTAGTYKPTAHIPTRDACDLCHNNVSWAPARMSHHGVLVGSCVSCHNGAFTKVNAQGRPGNHAAVAGLPDSQTERCETCHTTTSSWTASVHQHGAGDYGRCSACHNNRNAQGMTPGHIPTSGLSGNCDSCHTSFASFSSVAGFNHTSQGVIPGMGNCANCHNTSHVGSGAESRPASHSAGNLATQTCDSAGCHASTASWVVDFVHAPADAVGNHTCKTCHGEGTTALGINVNFSSHIPLPAAAGQCDSCHKSQVTFAPAQMDHSVVTTLACETCHTAAFESQGAQVKSPAHIPTTTINSAWACGSCHTSRSTFRPANMDHSGTIGKCSACHNGSYLDYNAQPKTAGHVSTKAECSDCHTTSSWATRTINHDDLTNPSTSIGSHNCSACHNGTTAYDGVKPLSKSPTHIPTTLECDYCHKSYAGFASVTMNHTGVVTCSNCHDGSYLFANALAKESSPIPHIPTTQDCAACHKDPTYSSFFVDPDTINGAIHTGVAGKCATCHSGGYVTSNAQMKPTSHVPTGAQCDDCHKITTSWATRTVKHDLFTPPRFIGDGSCETCHNGTTTYSGQLVMSKPTNHIPTDSSVLTTVTDRNCDTCHTSFTAFSPATMATVHPHTAGKCSSCHNGSYVGVNAQAKSSGHISTTAECNICHTTSNTANYTTFQGATIDHTTFAGYPNLVCANCHDDAQARGKGTGHIPTTTACTLCHTTAVSGGYQTWVPGLMGAAQHTSTTGPLAGIGSNSCITCHGGTFTSIGAQAKTNNHVSTTAACDTCHTSTAFTTWTDATYSHTSADTGKCATCHYTNGPGKGMNPTHIPTGAITCDNCHKTFSAFVPASMSHTGLTGCMDCHGQSSPRSTFQMVVADPSGLPVDHIPTGVTQCSLCHTNTSNFFPASMNHAGTSGACQTCHNGSYTGYGAVGAPATILTSTGSSVSHSASTTCDSAGCHAGSNYTSWVTTWNHSAYRTAPFTSGITATSNCANSGCHVSGGGALAPSASHLGWLGQTGGSGVTGTCNTCHTNFTSFSPASMKHTGVVTGTCENCHSGGYASIGVQGKSAGHLATTAACDSCHTNTANFTSWALAAVDHRSLTNPNTGAVGVAVGDHSCANSSCHGGGAGITGKPAGMAHIPTTPANAACDICHSNTSSFAAWTMDHNNGGAAYNTATCTTCHNNASTALYPGVSARSANHIATTSTNCKDCHTDTVSWSHWTMGAAGHAQVSTNCNSCHTGTGFGTKAGPTHIPTGSAQCSSCHTGFVSFSGAVMSHTGVSTNCATCHDATSTYTVATKLNKAVHIPQASSYACTDCHSAAQFTSFSSGVNMSHTYTAGTCNSCHSGGYTTQKGTSPGLGAQTKADAPTTHSVTAAQCDTCHTQNMTYQTWHLTAAKPDHGAYNRLTQTCNGSGCHTATLATFTPHIPTTSVTSGKCGVCHLPTYPGWGPAVMDHSTDGFAPDGLNNNTCLTCHGVTTYASSGAKTTADKANHLATGGADCDTCHTSTSNWALANTHNATTTNCVSCHVSGNSYGTKFADAQTHIPMTTAYFTSVPACSVCHTNPANVTGGNYSFSTNVTMNHATVKVCASCHNGNYVSQKASLGLGALGTASFANHIPSGTTECNQCHLSYSTFAGATMKHTALAAASLANCNACHKVSTYASSGAMSYLDAPTKTTLHTGGTVTVNTVQCSVCHISTAYSSWADGKYHKGATTTAASGSCTLCHNGTLATAEPANHSAIDTGLLNGSSMTCNNCHTSVTSWTVSKLGATGHNNSLGYPSGSGRCTVCHNTGASFPGSLSKKTLGSHEGSKNTGTNDCSMSGCHKPLGNEGSSYSSW